MESSEEAKNNDNNFIYDHQLQQSGNLTTSNNTDSEDKYNNENEDHFNELSFDDQEEISKEDKIFFNEEERFNKRFPSPVLKVVEKEVLVQRIAGIGSQPQENSESSFFSFIPSLIKSISSPKLYTPSPPVKTFSTTRPRVLPPKSQEEEVKHLKEYNEMMENYKKKVAAEEQEKQRKKKITIEKEKKIISDIKYWEEVIIPDWDNRKEKNSTKEMWWSGIPPKVREQVWLKAAGNELNITREMYNSLLEEGKKISKEKPKSIEQILLDLPRTFRGLSFFQDDGPFSHSLQEVLEAFVIYKPELGYVQGMSYVAALLLLNMNAYEAFQCMCNMIKSECHQVFYSMDVSQMEFYYKAFDLMIQHYLPSLYQHFQNIDFYPRFYLFDWILTIYTKCVPLDIAAHIIDVFLLEGPYFMFRAALGILKYYSKRIKKFDFEESKLFMQSLVTEDIDDCNLFDCIKSIDVTDQDFTNFLNIAKTG